MKVRKWFALPLVLALIFLSFGSLAQAAAVKAITIYLDGRPIQSDVAPYILPKVDITMVPIRVVSEGLGASVDWSAKTKTATITQAGSKIQMTSGQKYATVNGSRVSLDASVETKSGRVTVPLRFVGESLGLTVNWDGTARTITLVSGSGSADPDAGSGGNAGGGSDNGAGGDPSSGSGAGGDNGTGGVPSNPGSGSGGSNGGNAGGGVTGLRGAWISSVYNLDWPSTASYGDRSLQQNEFASMLDRLKGMGMNAVFLQVRPAGDALYKSNLVPWSKVLTGMQGVDPGYDPLAVLIEEAHKRGMEFHAWFNPFRANVDAKTDKLASNHVAVQHPDWIVASGTQLYINPGIPEARQHIIDVVMEVVSQYDIDGVHLDDYFYPSGGVFSDDATFALYNPKSILLKADWRRDNINTFVQKLGAAIHKAKPKVSFGISPFGVWRNVAKDPTGSDTKAGVTAYDNMYADVRTWIRQGWVDYVAPQIYWSLSFSTARYDKLVDWWSNEVAGTSVKLYVGHAPYKLGTTETGWQSSDEIINQLRYNAQNGRVQGDLFFSARHLLTNTLGVGQALQKYYQP
ncbi:family 10 glycosylhydrolase [Cohnella sp. REN36]|uniref:family 10 glycosylhydrolase n=1 Tax=Cohnella sp. REN36 TaxID=2887347 RepID=UPI001D14867E|nr:family 10 glycosylhydrolase [Cohnella sp. REN36]MCC3371725.1 family 10 glycosylhydrolase [Cohnella sp. REN36]